MTAQTNRFEMHRLEMTLNFFFFFGTLSTPVLERDLVLPCLSTETAPVVSRSFGPHLSHYGRGEDITQMRVKIEQRFANRMYQI